MPTEQGVFNMSKIQIKSKTQYVLLSENLYSSKYEVTYYIYT